jgi:hypothetical protein
MPCLRLLKPTGSHLKKNAIKNLVLGILCLSVFLALFVTSIDILPLYVDAGRYTTVRGTAIGMFLVMWFLFLFYLYPRYRAGMIGEEKVTKALLSSLDDEYSMFNDVRLKHMAFGNIDHIVVGPTGVFAIETKNLKGRIRYYGDSWEGTGQRSPSRQARINAMRVKRILSSLVDINSKPFWVQGVVVFADSKVELIPKEPPEHVDVMKINELAEYIKSKPRRFDSQEIERIEAEIRNHVQADQKVNG